MSQSATHAVRPDGRLRLPPGQRLTEGWPVLHYGSIPRLDPETWRFHVWGLVEEERKFTWDEFNALGETSDTSDIHCVTTWSKYDNEWAGVPFRALYDSIKVKPEAKVVMIHSYGGYTTNVPLDTKEHGWPLRLVVPNLYFWKSAKWVGGMQFIDEDRPGFWEMYGYHMYGDPWREQRYS